jgi:class 3 adenylate cyclase
VRPTSDVDRILATVMFVDIVGSTEQASALGDARWRDLLANYHERVSREITRVRGRVIDTLTMGVRRFHCCTRVQCASRLNAR